MNRRKDLQNEFGVKRRTMGVFQIVNARSGKRYVASSPTLDSAWQREKFMLDTGSHPNSALQQAYTEQAGADFDYEVLERLELGDETGVEAGIEPGNETGNETGNVYGNVPESKAGSRAGDEAMGSGGEGAQPGSGALNRSAVLSYRTALKKLERKWLDELKPYEPEGYNRPPK